VAKRGGRARRERAEAEALVFGANAAHAIADKRRDDVVRVLLVEERVKEFGPLLKWCAQNKKAYRIVSAEEIARFCGSLHHEGICLVTKRPKTQGLEEAIELIEEGPAVVVVLDGVQNPNNVGAIVRVAAHFGAPIVVHREADEFSSNAIARTAEGGAEHVALVATADPAGALRRLKRAGLARVGTDAGAGRSLFEERLPRRMAVVLGAERTGTSREVLGELDRLVAIPGTGAVESLNVSTACAILLSEHWRQHRKG
jgi:RNA methyltransferase, TrmH family